MILYPPYKSTTPEWAPIDEYKKAVEECKKSAELNPIEQEIMMWYAEYDTAFNRGNIHTIKPHTLTDAQQSHLRGLYGSSKHPSPIIRKHIDGFTFDKHRMYHYKCPYCLISEPNTIEHILPESKFPEYAVHVWNLIPCCSKCNSHKSSQIINPENGQPFTIDFYYHDPESFRFLWVDFNIDRNGKPHFAYRIDFPDNADPVLKAIIANHFKRLHLIERYDKEAIMHSTAIEMSLTNFHKSFPHADGKRFAKDYIESCISGYGLNHYYRVLLTCMSESDDYMEYLTLKIGD